jgi:hypothetical protein
MLASADSFVAVDVKQLLDLQFIRETLESLRIIDRTTGRPTAIGSELGPFFQDDHDIE